MSKDKFFLVVYECTLIRTEFGECNGGDEVDFFSLIICADSISEALDSALEYARIYYTEFDVSIKSIIGL